MTEQPKKMDTLNQVPHSGKTEADLLVEWRELVQDVYAQALVRCLDREEIDQIIPDEIAGFFRVDSYGDHFVVRAMRSRDAVAIVQEICDSDCAKMHELQEAELAEAEAEAEAGES